LLFRRCLGGNTPVSYGFILLSDEPQHRVVFLLSAQKGISMKESKYGDSYCFSRGFGLFVLMIEIYLSGHGIDDIWLHHETAHFLVEINEALITNRFIILHSNLQKPQKHKFSQFSFKKEAHVWGNICLSLPCTSQVILWFWKYLHPHHQDRSRVRE